jgi:hypothetical protein
LIDDKADVIHTHTKSEITDFSHNHDERYYTETEVNNIIQQTKQDLLNRIHMRGDKSIIQTNETTDFKAYLIEDGMPSENKKIYFYKKEDD